MSELRHLDGWKTGESIITSPEVCGRLAYFLHKMEQEDNVKAQLESFQSCELPEGVYDVTLVEVVMRCEECFPNRCTCGADVTVEFVLNHLHQILPMVAFYPFH